MTFIELAEKVLEQSNAPMTTIETWNEVINPGLAKKLDFKGKLQQLHLEQGFISKLETTRTPSLPQSAKDPSVLC